MKRMTKKRQKQLVRKHFGGLLDDLSFFYHVTGDTERSKNLKKAAKAVRKRKS
jgi:hypothetical protein